MRAVEGGEFLIGPEPGQDVANHLIAGVIDRDDQSIRIEIGLGKNPAFQKTGRAHG